MPDPALPSPPAASLHHPLPAMVLIDRKVCFVDELQGIIQEAGLGRDTKLVPENIKYIRGRKEKKAAIDAAMRKYRAEVTEPAWAILRERKAASRHRGGVIKEPVAGDEDSACYYTEVLDGLEPFFSEVADAPSVTSLSLKISWPPEHVVRRDCSIAYISSCHRNLLVLYVGAYRPCNTAPVFYLVYNTCANSVAIVLPLSPCVLMSHGDIGAGVAVLCDNRDRYVLVELLLHRDDRSYLPTNKGTLFMWTGPDPPTDGKWIHEEVVVPLPADQDATTSAFFADMVFAISSDSLCWVDLLKGILVYSLHTKRFHFIPLPKGYATNTLKLRLMDGRLPEEYYRSMCCDDWQNLRFVSMDGYTQGLPMDENVIIRTWNLYRRWSQTRSRWELLYSIRIRDLWHDPVFKDWLKLPWMPGFPVISMRQPHVIYLSVPNYEINLKHATGYYVLSVDMALARVVSVFKVPSGDPSLMIFTYGVNCYQKKENLKAPVVTVAVRRGDLVPRGKGVADDGESRSNRAMWTSGVADADDGESRSNRAMWTSSGDIGGLSGIGPPIRVSPCEGESLPYPAIGRLPLTARFIVPNGPSSSSFCPVGLQCVLDQTEK